MADDKKQDNSEVLAGNRSGKVKGAFEGVTEHTFYNQFYLTKPWNPDELYQKDGDYSTYEAMRLDDQIHTSLILTKDSILGGGFLIAPQEDGQDDMVDELTKILGDDLDKPFMNYLEEMLDSIDMGFSLTERIYKVGKDGKLGLKDLRTRHPGGWLIHTDDMGNILSYEQQGASSVKITPQEDKLIHLINRQKYLNPFGNSDLRPAYEAYISKRQAVKYLDIYLETAANPKPLGRYPANAKAGIAANLSKILKSFMAKTSLVIPKEVDIEFLEVKTNGEAFHKAINLFNMMIGRSLMIPDLMGFAGSETSGGSFSLGKEQISIFNRHIQRKKNDLEGMVNKHILSHIIKWNYGNVENPPKFEFKPLTDELVTEYADLFLKAVNGRAYRPTEEEINHFRDIIKFPKGEVTFDDPEVETELPESEPPKDLKEPIGPKDEDDEGEPPKDGEIKKETEKLSTQKKQFASEASTEEIEKKTDFKAVEKLMDKSVADILKDASPIIEDMQNDLIEQVKKKKILENKDVDAIGDLKLKDAQRLRAVIGGNFKKLMDESISMGKKEVPKTEEFAKKKKQKKKKKGPKDDLVADEFLAVIDEEIFQFIGDFEITQLDNTSNILAEAMKNGDNLAATVSNMKGFSDLTRIQVERFARTKTTEVYNRGRLSFFNSIDSVVGYKYSATIDGRTTDICAGLHNKQFKKGEEPIPPLHWNAVLENTLIKTKSGDIKIQDIKKGDLVMSHTGKYCEVYDTMTKFEDKEYYELELDSGEVLKITGEHPVYTGRGWIRTDELNLSDDVICLKDINNA